MKFLSLYILLFSLFGSHVHQFLQICCGKYFVVVPSCVVWCLVSFHWWQKAFHPTHLPKPATHFSGFFKTVKTFLFVKWSTKYDITQNVKTLQIHDIRNSDFDGGSWEFHTQALELEFLNIIRVNLKSHDE